MATLTEALRRSLLAQTCCGMPALCEYLDGEIDFLWSCVADGCNQQIIYLHTQLALIEAAQVFARNQVDTQIRAAAFNLQERYTAHEDRLTEGENSATGRQCAWTAATSQQFFHRDSTDNTVAFNESNSQATAERIEHGYDQSTRRTSGTGAHFSRVQHILDILEGESDFPGRGTNESQSTRTATNAGGTGPLVPLGPSTWDSTPFFSLTPPFVNIAGPTGEPAPVNYPASSDELCPPFDPQDPNRPLCIFIGHSSYGYGHHGKFRFNLGIPGVGIVTVEYDYGKNERQYFHCSGGSIVGDSFHYMTERSDTTSTTKALPKENGSRSNETTTVVHLVRKQGISTRRGLTTVDAEDRSVGIADGKSHSESERDNKAQAYQQRRKEEQTVKHQEAHLRHTEHMTDDDSRKKYGQISEHLAQMWKRVYTRLTTIERQYAAKFVGASMGCNCRRQGCNLCMTGVRYA